MNPLPTTRPTRRRIDHSSFVSRSEQVFVVTYSRSRCDGWLTHPRMPAGVTVTDGATPVGSKPLRAGTATAPVTLVSSLGVRAAECNSGYA